MELIIRGDIKEIAAAVVAIQIQLKEKGFDFDALLAREDEPDDLIHRRLKRLY